MKRVVGVYRAIYPVVSQSFITEQLQALQTFSPYILARHRTGAWAFPGYSICNSAKHSFRDLAYAATGSSLLYGLSSLPKLDLIHAHFGPDGIYAMRIAQKLNIPLIVTFHGFDAMSSIRQMLFSVQPSVYQFLIFRQALKRYSCKFIAVSDFIKQELIRQGYPSDKIVRHYIGVDTNKFFPIQYSPERRYILSVARHSEGKGLYTLLNAFAKIYKHHPDVTLIQIGDGELSPELRRFAAALDLGKQIEFLGSQSHDVVRTYMQGAEVFAFPSQSLSDGSGIEALGIVLNEASACGVPIVATDIGGIPEAVLDGVTGYLVNQRDSTALAERLNFLLTEREHARNMGFKGREFVCANFDIHKQTKLLEDIYSAAIND